MTNRSTADSSAFVELVRNALRPDGRKPADSCPDPELIAAYYERSAGQDELPRLDRHLSTCRACHAQLAALAREGDSSRARMPDAPSWQFLQWRFLVPIASAVAIATAWLVARPQPPAPSSQVATSAPVEPAPERPLTQGRDQSRGGATASLDSRDHVASPLPTRESAVPMSAPIGPAPGPSVMRESDSRGGSAASLEGRDHNPSPLRTNESAPRTETGSALFATVVISPDPAVRWRLTRTGIERSLDAGQRWQPQVRRPTAPTALRKCLRVMSAGRSAGGSVWRTADGERWLQTSSPTTAHLVAVQARDALTATVTTADAVRYVTTDGGRTWTTPQR
jgi:hypothetical protein